MGAKSRHHGGREERHDPAGPIPPPPAPRLSPAEQRARDLQAAAGNAATASLRPGPVAPGPALQRAYLDLSEGSRLPDKGSLSKKMGAKVSHPREAGSDQELHIFAHSSGENLQEISDVAGMEAPTFADWLVQSGRAFAQGDYNMSAKRSYHIYIHACASTKFARAVKIALETINPDMNHQIKVYGTVGISATSPEGEAVVIPLKFTNEWLKFEAKLAKAKGRKEDLLLWEKRYSKFPDGYESY